MKKPVYVLIAVSLVLVLLPTAATALLATDTMGCPERYWKQPRNWDSWVDYQPTDSYSDVFEVAGGDKTLLEALKKGGGGEKALGRQAVAALLNASNPGVGYFCTVDDVIATVRDAYDSGDFEKAKNYFEEQNELDCPLGRGVAESPTPTIGVE
ncbi:MAG TPA: hypothetical protein VM075_06690 [Anaerolineae bacterium]|nr:hypothetical protein [Anaerolineae bacterium]